MYFSADPKEYDDTTSCSAVATMCKFPFKVNEKTYTSCTDDIVVEDDDVIIIDKDGTKKQTFQWCATSVNENQFMKKDKWGICDLWFLINAIFKTEYNLLFGSFLFTMQFHLVLSHFDAL